MSAQDPPITDDLAKLYVEHSTWLHGWLRRRVGDTFTAADLAQDTFLSLLDRKTAAVEIRKPRPFLATVAGRLVAHRHRRQDKRLVLDGVTFDVKAMLPDNRRRQLVLMAETGVRIS